MSGARRSVTPAVAVAAFAGALTLLGAAPAHAHLMPAKQGTLNVVGNAVFGVVSISVSSLHGFDDDHDGSLSAMELAVHGSALRIEIDRRFAITSGGSRGHTETLDVVLSPEHESASDVASHIIVLKHVVFETPVQDLALACDLFGDETDERQLTITATRHRIAGAAPDVEAAMLTPLSPPYAGCSPYGLEWNPYLIPLRAATTSLPTRAASSAD